MRIFSASLGFKFYLYKSRKTGLQKEKSFQTVFLAWLELHRHNYQLTINPSMRSRHSSSMKLLQKENYPIYLSLFPGVGRPVSNPVHKISKST